MYFDNHSRAVVWWGVMVLHQFYSGSPDNFMVMLVALLLTGSSCPYWGSYPLRLVDGGK
jgi:hypothetical protein